ncbi:hypothetical protein [Rhodoplanes sp. SY1]|uniref:hypothetical protein n=1 Tax=Rhodoplanes sp. SY1 TaxID=3166646 RepID=UPI0038B5EE2A
MPGSVAEGRPRGQPRSGRLIDVSDRREIVVRGRTDSVLGMQHPRSRSKDTGTPLPDRFVSRLRCFADLFTRPTWSTALVLLAGLVLAPGRRTVASALRILGRDCDPDFCTFHRVLNRAAWHPGQRRAACSACWSRFSCRPAPRS